MSSRSARRPRAGFLSDRALLNSMRNAFRRRDSSPEYRRRLDALAALLSGETAAAAAGHARVSVRTLRRWLAIARAIGINALNRADGQILPDLPNNVRRRLIAELHESPRAVGLRRDTWGGGTLALHLKRRYRVRLSVRHCRRLLRRIGIVGPPSAQSAEPVPGTRHEGKTHFRQFRSERQSRRDSLKRIQRLASSGLPMQSFLSTLLELIEEAIPSGPNQAFLPGPHPSMNSPRLIARGFNPSPDTLRQFGPEAASPEISGMIPPPGPLSPKRPVLRHHEVTLPHFYRSAGYNEIFRKNRQHHALSLGWIEDGRMDFRCSLWRSESMNPFSEEEVRFAAAIAPHISHGIRVAQALALPEPSESGFAPLRGAPGMVYLDERFRLLGMNARAEEILQLLGAFDDYGSRFFSPDGRGLAFAALQERLRRIFMGCGDADPSDRAPCEIIRFSDNGLIARLKGFSLAGASGPAGFGIIVEVGEPPPIARRRIQHRWRLSTRQAQILELLAGPDSVVDNARKLNLSPGTFRSHIRDIMERLELDGLDGLREFARHEVGRAVFN